MLSIKGGLRDNVGERNITWVWLFPNCVLSLNVEEGHITQDMVLVVNIPQRWKMLLHMSRSYQWAWSLFLEFLNRSRHSKISTLINCISIWQGWCIFIINNFLIAEAVLWKSVSYVCNSRTGREYDRVAYRRFSEIRKCWTIWWTSLVHWRSLVTVLFRAMPPH